MAHKKSPLQIRAEYALAAALVGALRYPPLPLAQSLAGMATRTLDKLVPKLRRVASVNLGFAYPNLSPAEHGQIVDGVFRSLARMLVSLARLPDLNASNVAQWIGYEGLENYWKAKEQERGVLVATAHLGNWELSAFAHALMTEPMNIMVRPLDNPLIDRMVETRRMLSGNRLIFKNDGARAVLRALKKNEAVGVLIDQNTAAAEGAFVNFFGKQACANTTFARLAYHAKAPVIPGFALWDSQRGRYTLRFYPPLPITGDERADTQVIQSKIEEIVRLYPDQWMWIHRRWKTRPPGEQSPY